MNLTLALLLAPLAVGFAVALSIFSKEREPRLAVASLLLPALAARHLLAPTPLADSLRELSATPYAWALGFELGINALAALAVVALARSLGERNRAERVQWDSMEGVRTLGEILATRRGALDDGLRELLELGCQRFGLEFGVHARIEGEHYSLISVRAPEAAAIKAGDVFDLNDTVCRRTVENGNALGIERVSSTHIDPGTGADRLGFEAYLGAPVSADGKVVGTLYFASEQPRSPRFNGVEKQLLLLMADWVGSQIEREGLALAAASSASSASESAEPATRGERGRLVLRRSEAVDRRRVDVNAAITQLEPELRAALPAERKLALSLDPSHPSARLYRHELDRVLWSLFWHAIEAAPEAAALTLSTAATEAAPGAGDDAARFILLAVSVDGPGLDSAGLARLFEDSVSDAPIATASGRLSLPRALRLLRSQGGDLSAHSDPALGTTLSAYLPLSDSPFEAADSGP